MGLAEYFSTGETDHFYREKTFVGTDEEYLEEKKNSSTVFVSNISISVKEERIWELFMLCGPVKRVIMGVNRNTLRFCGFCFVEFYSKDSVSIAIVYLRGFKLDLSPLNIDSDYGFADGRQYGRGVFGGRVKSDKLYLETQSYCWSGNKHRERKSFENSECKKTGKTFVGKDGTEYGKYYRRNADESRRNGSMVKRRR